MKKRFFKRHPNATTFPIGLLTLAISQALVAQEETKPTTSNNGAVEEVLVLGRMKSAANDMVMERMNAEVSVDLMEAELIGRIGDSTVAAALTRMPSVTLVDGKFVYIRGLGERYSSTTLNGAAVPSPDLTRNVIPLDIFPTSIVDSLEVQKVATADMPAAFGGGSVDIRTRSTPDDLVFSVEIGTKMNTESRADTLQYNGGEDDRWGKDDGKRAFSATLDNALDQYWGDFTPSNIRDLDHITLDQAEDINRNLITELNRDISVYRDTSPQKDISANMSGGNVWSLENGIEFGFILGGDYERTTRNTETTTRILGFGDEGFTEKLETTNNVSITGDLSFGLRLNEDNVIETTSIYIRNTDDEVAVSDILNTNKPMSGGLGFRDYDIRYEERELEVNQIHGEHALSAETIDSLGVNFLSAFEGLEATWYYSDSESKTDIPSEIKVTSDTVVDPTNGKVLSERVGRFSSAASYKFTDLKDYVDSYGWELKFPFELGDFNIAVSGGNETVEKTRIYKQTQLYIDTKDTGLDALQGPLGSVFSNNSVLNSNNNMLISVAGDNEDSYIAANKLFAGYGKLDVTWQDTLRLVSGVRWEDYKQVSLPWNPLNYTGSQLLPIPYDDPNAVANYFNDATFIDDDTFYSAALTYMTQNFWAEDFQLRASFAQTTVRPDLREISKGSYRDPITGILVFGNPNVIPSNIDNFDLRAEWYFSSGDNFTATLFTKDIDNPIEFFEAAASDDNIAAEIINAESGSITGLELEFLKNLSGASGYLDPFFVQGNVTFLENEIVAGDKADAPTNAKRDMAGASDMSGNLILGFDSPGAKHSATVSLNYFSERLFYAGRNGRQDSYEQPFTSLNATYAFYPTDNFTVKLKGQNLLDETITIKQRASTNSSNGIVYSDDTILEQKYGQTFSIDVKYTF